MNNADDILAGSVHGSVHDEQLEVLPQRSHHHAPGELLFRHFKFDYLLGNLCLISLKLFLFRMLNVNLIVQLQPRSKWGNFSASIAEFAKDIILREVRVLQHLEKKNNNRIKTQSVIAGQHYVPDRVARKRAHLLRRTRRKV